MMRQSLSSTTTYNSAPMIRADATMDCHDLPCKSRNDRMLDSSGNAILPSLRGEAEAIQPQSSLRSPLGLKQSIKTKHKK